MKKKNENITQDQKMKNKLNSVYLKGPFTCIKHFIQMHTLRQ